MAKKKDILKVDDKALSYAGKVIPIRNIAYFEKYRIKQPYGCFTGVILGATAILAGLGYNEPIFAASSLIGGFIVWLVALLILHANQKYALILQTNAGDAPRLFETKNEDFLDRLIGELIERLSGNQNLPPLVANMKAETINFGDHVMGDRIKIDQLTGQVGAIGSGSRVHDISFTQTWNQMRNSIDLPRLADELSKLRQEMKRVAVIPEHDIAISDVAKAEQAAKAGDGPKVVEHLRSTGKWALDVATKIGTSIAVEAIKLAVGL